MHVCHGELRSEVKPECRASFIDWCSVNKTTCVMSLGDSGTQVALFYLCEQ